MIVDFRNNNNLKNPLSIKGTDVEIVSSYKYLGCTLQQDLKWDSHVHHQIKKANKRMYHVRCLKKLHINSKLITMFYNSVVSSVLVYALPCWYSSCTEKDKKEICKFKKKLCRMIAPNYHTTVEDPTNSHQTKSIALANRIIQDPTHALHQYFKLLPHGKRLNMIYSKTKRFHDTFVPTAIKLYNTSH